MKHYLQSQMSIGNLQNTKYLRDIIFNTVKGFTGGFSSGSNGYKGATDLSGSNGFAGSTGIQGVMPNGLQGVAVVLQLHKFWCSICRLQLLQSLRQRHSVYLEIFRSIQQLFRQLYYPTCLV